jgi:hypothetical protein
MGCNVHLHVEIRVGGAWHHYNHPYVDRDYALFAKMAGARNRVGSGITPISRPRGLPISATFTTIFCYNQWGAAARSASYLTSHEVKELYDWGQHSLTGAGQDPLWFENRFGFLFGQSYPLFHQCRASYPAELEDFRFVFWFDN